MDSERIEIIKDIHKLEEFGIFVPSKSLNITPIEELRAMKMILTKQYEYEKLKRHVLTTLKLSFQTIKEDLPPDIVERIENDPDFSFLF